jgi:pimeloyl-ACP methyl ester carboxylesterase
MLELDIAESGQGEPVVLVHGSWGDLHSWDALVAELPGYRLIRYSRRGHSGSECPPGQGLIEEDVGDLAVIAETLGPVHLVGNSLGAEIALRLAIARPELVRSVALHEPGFWSLAPDDPAVREILEGLRPAIELLEAGAVEAGTREFAEWVFGPGAWEEAVPDALKRVMLANAPTFLDEERAPDNGMVDARLLPEVTVPILLSTGEESHPAFLVVTNRLAAALPHPERATIAGAGHVPHRSHPREYAALLLSFWPASTRGARAPAGASPSRSAGSAA